MTEALLWQTLEDCFRKGDTAGIAALADEVALTDEPLAATLRWIVKEWGTVKPSCPEQNTLWACFAPESAEGFGCWKSFRGFWPMVSLLHKYRLKALEFFQ